ncbi:hypothetical protein GCM10020367_44050 [Streptomyces sannanensis]|uniref:OmpR/PhoB-type domain-containing protein n=1 Tax=Streptomyces sannanensis TaxID=285536 RepID=A0ABP6SG58_9ACTN
MEFRLLGPVEARRDGILLPLAGAKIHTVLAALLLAGGRVVPDSRLSEFLWGWEPPATMSAQIYTYISRLRKQLGDGITIVRRQPGYALDAGDSWIDAVEYDRLDRLGREALDARHFEKASTLLTAALELWRGAPLANATEFLAEAETPQWGEAWSTTMVCRIEADLALGRHTELVPELTRLVAAHPLSERLRAQLMTALYRSSRQADALAVYRDGCTVLREELGIDPGPTLREVHRQVLDGDVPGPAVVRAEPGSVLVRPRRTPAPAMLPPDIPDFTGHALPLAEVVYELRGASAASQSARHRRVVITGMPGSGKSALAVRAAHLLRTQFPDGQLYADLVRPDGSPRDPHEVLRVFLHTLGIPEQAVPRSLEECVRLYRGVLTDRRVLVVLDNAVNSAQVRPLLPVGTRCRTILTSLMSTVAGEGVRLVRLHPLSTAESLGLLAAVAGRERLAAEPAAAAALVELCDRSPLALRICGLRLADRPQQQVSGLLARLAPAEHRLDELRHGTLDVRASLRFIHAALSPEARHTLGQLTLLPETEFSAAQTVPVLRRSERRAEEALEELADARLIDIAGVSPDRRLVYRFAPLVRLFAQEQRAGNPAADATGTGTGTGTELLSA